MHPEWGLLEPDQIETWLRHVEQSLAVKFLEVRHFLMDSLEDKSASCVVVKGEFESKAIVF